MKELRTWIEINKKAIGENLESFRKLAGKKCRIMAVVKSNAYGHGLIGFSKETQRLGADWFGVDSIVEALVLRKNRIKKPILVLGHTLPERLNDATEYDISLTISSFEGLKNLKNYRHRKSKDFKIHLKIDTGMHRQGFFVDDLPRVISFLKSKTPEIKVEGLYTHFAAAKDPVSPAVTLRQLKEFKKAIDVVEQAGFRPIKHAAATGGAILFPEARLDMARIGIGLYGLRPSPEIGKKFVRKLKLTPVLSWKTIIGEVKNVKKGEGIGYDFTEHVRRNSRIAILPIGYWHGYPRVLSSVGHVLIRGRRAKILGRVSMDMTVVDITGIKNAKVGDIATLIGKDGKNEITTDELARFSGTINYEFITRINPLIERVYL